MLNICLLGCGGTMPSPNRYLTALLVSYNGKMLLIDCGEGTQVSMKLVGWGFKNIDVICFTHYHGDHIIGLPGLLLTIANSGRNESLTLVGPIGLKDVVKGLGVLFPNLPYELKIIELDMVKTEELKLSEFIINSLPVDHTVSCVSYAIEVRRSRKFNREKAEEQKIPKILWNRLKKGEKITYEGRILTSEMVLGKERKGIKVCYTTDTRPIKEIVNFIEESDIFICEGMYGGDESAAKALENKHMLFSEAADLAKEGRVKELWLTHFGPALSNPEEFLENAVKIFSNTKIGKDRMVKELFFNNI